MLQDVPPCRVGTWPAVLGADGSLWAKGNPAASCYLQHRVLWCSKSLSYSAVTLVFIPMP